MNKGASSGPVDPRVYCQQMLLLNPADDPQRVLRKRRRQLGLKSAVAATQSTFTRPHPAARKRIEERLAQLRSQFWQLPLAQLQQELSSLDVQPFPELQPALERLKVLAQHRPAFAQLFGEQQVDRPLLLAWKAMAAETRMQAAPIKNRFMTSLTDARKLKSAKSTVRMIERDFPQLFELEKDWFQTILARKKPHRPDVETASDGGGFDFDFDTSLMSSPFFVILVMFFLRLLLRSLLQ